MHPLTPAFQSALSYSVQNEDYRTELALLNQFGASRPLRVLMVASSGENVLSILADNAAATVWAVDLNPAQVHLCALRAAACQILTQDQQLQFLGAIAGGDADRLTLYDRVRAALSPAARDFWDERRSLDIAFGVHHVGRNDCLMHDLQERLTEVGIAPLKSVPADADLAVWQAAYASVMTPARIRERFGLPSEALAARISAISGILAETHFRALQKPDALANLYVTTVFDNAYATSFGEAGLPLYLQQGGQEKLRNTGIEKRLHLTAGNLISLAPSLAAEHGGFDLISLSNIADWMDDVQFDKVVRDMLSCLRTGGVLLARTATGSSMIIDVLRRHLHVDELQIAALPDIERGPWFRTIAAGQLR